MISLVFSGVWDRRGTFPLLPSSLWLDVTNSKSKCVILVFSAILVWRFDLLFSILLSCTNLW